MSFEVGDRVIVSGAMNPNHDGTEAVVHSLTPLGPDLKITRLPDNDNHGLHVGKIMGFFESSVKHSPRIVGQHIQKTDVRAGDRLRVTYKTGTLEHTVTGVALGKYNDRGYIFASSGVLFDNRWDQSTILLLDVREDEHPLERCVPGDRFRYEVSNSRHTLEMAKYAQGFWIREAYDITGKLISLEQRTEEQARRAFDDYNGEMVKSKA